MKKIIFLLAAAFLVAACNKNSQPDNGRLTVVSTITIINDMVKQIGKDKINAVSICGVGYDPHTYKSVPGDSKTIAGADLVFINGFGLEGWIQKLIEASGGNKKTYTVTEGITPLKDEKGHGDPDPHCWFNARYAKIYVQNIVRGLTEIDPANSEFYKQNAADYLKKLDELHEWALKEINHIPAERRILITSHDAFRYFGEAYNIRIHALQGISTEAKAQTKDVAALVNLIRSANLPSVFIETSVNPKLLEQIASETGAVVGGTLFSDSTGEDGTPEGTYIGAFRHNVTTIVNALSAGGRDEK